MSRTARRRHSIAVQVWGMVLTAGALLAALIVVNTQADQSRERELVTRDLDRRVAQTSDLLTGEVGPGNETESTLAGVGEQAEILALGASCRQALSGLQRAVEIGYLEVVDADGRVLCSPEDVPAGTPWAKAADLLGHIAAREAATDGPITDRKDGSTALYTVVPLDLPQAAGLLYVSPTQVALSPDDTSGDVETVVVDRRSGTVLMRYPEAAGVVGSRVSGRDLLEVPGTEGLAPATGVDGVERLYRGVNLTGSSFVLLVGEEEAEAFASAERNLRRNLLFGAGLLLALLVLGLLLQSRVVRPARLLRRAIERAGAGEDAVAPTDGPTELAMVGVAFNDMHEARRRHEEALAHQARHDPLTDLPNRTLVTEELAERIASGVPCAAVFVDLDRFKLINDAHGHAVGDEVLVAVGRNLVDTVGPDDVVGRFGGDEFVVVVPEVGLDQALEVAERISAALSRPLDLGTRELFVSGSVGIAVHAEGEDADAVLRHADTAMYKAKERGRNCAAVFDSKMREDARRLLRTENDLHRAIERDELLLHFQPVIDLHDGTVVGAEALLRWQHPDNGLMPPVDFIPVAEETGLIVPIGSWVLREACHWAASTSERLGRPLVVSVNVSPRQVSQPDFVEIVADALAITGLAPSQLTVEVTESLLVQDAELATEALGLLRSQGVRIAIDDFGTGWSSLTYLQTLPVDEIKLDRSYVSRVPFDTTAATIVSSLVGMAHALGLSVTAEGVETADQLDFLRLQRCGKAQGYLFQRPVAGAALEAALDRTDWVTSHTPTS